MVKNKGKKNILKKIILIVIGVLILFIGYIAIYLYQAHHPQQLNKNERFCLRDTPYKMNPQLYRVLQFINEKTGKRNAIDGGINDVMNCLNVNYNPNLIDTNTAGYFQKLLSSREQLLIYLEPELEFEDDLLVAIPLVHELSHVNIYIKSKYYGDSTDISCLDNEAIAYMQQDLFFRLALSHSEQQQLLQSIEFKKAANSFLQTIEQQFLLGEKTLAECKQTVETDKEYNDCYTEKFTTEIKELIAPHYKKQCDL